MTLAAIYAAAMLYWLEDRSSDFTDTRDFVERRLADLGEIGRARHRLSTAIDHLPDPWRLLRPFRD
jgi:ubiquinone biosynthesis protein COQ9